MGGIETVIVGATISAARVQAGLTVAALARRAGWTRPHQSNIEAGRKVLTATQLQRLGEILGTDLEADVLRRSLLLAVTTAAGAVAASPLDRLTRPVTGRVGEADIQAVWETGQILTRMDLDGGGLTARTAAPRLVAWATELLKGSTSPRAAEAVAALSDRASWIAHDSGDVKESFRLSRAANLAAREGNDGTLKAHTTLDAAQYLSTSDPLGAVTIIDRAFQYARIAPLELANLHAVKAGYLAQAGDNRGALKELSASETVLSKAGTDRPDWAGYLDHTHILHVQGRAYAAAGRSDIGDPVLWHVIRDLPEGRGRKKAQILTSLAIRQWDSGHYSSARDTAAQAEQVSKGVASVRVQEKLSLMREKIASHV